MDNNSSPFLIKMRPVGWLLIVLLLMVGVVEQRQQSLTAVIAANTVDPLDEGGGPFEPEHLPHLTDAQRITIQAQIDANVARLTEQGLLKQAQDVTAVSLDWPLQQAAGFDDFGYHGVSYFVDHDTAFPDQLLDYTCGERTYDTNAGYNHQGTDFFLWPYGWNKMDNDEVEIVAAADGTIVLKQDGNGDRSCSLGGNWNAVYVQHADGSTAWYGHMKKGSLTSKNVGETVQTGDYLGIVGSSGSSTSPHLHLELYDAGNNLIDPYVGTCNTLNSTSWWLEEPPYYDSAINLLTSGTAAPIFPDCPQPETSNASRFFQPGDTIYLTAYFRDERNTLPTQNTVYTPDGAVYTSWNRTLSEPHFAASYWFRSYAIPADAQAGRWQYEVVFNGTTYTHDFYVMPALSPAGVSYTSFENDDLSLFAYEGERSALLVPVDILDPVVLSAIVAESDKAFDYLASVMGQTPPLDKHLNDKTTIAVVPSTCDSSCSRLGSTGIELLDAASTTLYEGVRDDLTFDSALFYGHGRNFWLTGTQLDYIGADDQAVVAGGYATFMQLMTVDATGVQPGPIAGMDADTYRAEVAALLNLYLADTTLTWENTVKVNQAPVNSAGLGAAELLASFLLALHDQYGDDFVNQVWQAAAARPDAQTTQDAVDNFIIAASIAANQNLTSLFVDDWRWPLSQAAQNELTVLFPEEKLLFLPLVIRN